VGFIGKIADDHLGDYVTQYFASQGIDITELSRDHDGHKTGLTFTEILSPEDSEILMYRNEAVDLYLTPEDVSEKYIQRAKMLVISGTGLAQSPSREAVLKALQLAKKNHVEVVFELDYRPYNWRSAEDTAIYYQLVASQADIVIGTEDEFATLRGQSGIANRTIATDLFLQGVKLVVIKSGQQGAAAYTSDGEVVRSGIYQTKVLKSFGAGDSFAAGFLYAYQHQLGLKTALQYGSAAASIVISQLSSSEAMPNLETLQNFVTTHQAQEVKSDVSQ